MRSKLILLVSCVFLVACATDDVKETGVTRDRAISIAKSKCPEYPDTFSFVDRAEWVPEKGFWAVELADRSGDHGRVYRINRNGEVIGTKDINEERHYDDNGGPYARGWWWY